MKKLLTSIVLIGTLFTLAGCSAAEKEPEEVPTPVATVSIPEGSGTDAPTATPTPTASPTPEATEGNSLFPNNGVDPKGLNRVEEREEQYLNVIGFSHNSPREIDGKTSVEIIADAEGTQNSRNYYLNIGYEYCSMAMADLVSDPKQLFNTLLGDLAQRLERPADDPVIQNGYSPVLNMALGTLCPERWQ